jgi:uncharacterized protein
MSPVFADTFYYLALINPEDEAHERAVALSQTLRAPVVTTAWILTEVADAMSDPRNRAAFVALLDVLRSDPEVEIVPASQTLFEQGLGLYTRRPDKDWSLTDCISIVTMGEREMTQALTADHHFVQAGFEALLKVG